MDATKIRLSAEETELVIRADWILTKNRVLQKVWQLLEKIQSEQELYMQHLPAEIRKVNAKISKGENYQGLPYLILDQPRYFNKDHIFAIRELFWWGNFFSSTLHLSGDYKIKYEGRISNAFELLQAQDFYICINTDPWEHHFETGNFQAIKDMNKADFEKIATPASFIKLSKKIPLQQWDNAEEKLLKIFETYVGILKS